MAASGSAALRGLLRAIDRNVTSVGGNSQWREFVLEQARASSSSGKGDMAVQQERVMLAQDLTFLIKNISHHQVRHALTPWHMHMPVPVREVHVESQWLRLGQVHSGLCTHLACMQSSWPAPLPPCMFRLVVKWPLL